MKSKIGLIGLAVMGANLAQNIADKKIPITVFNRTTEKTTAFIKEFGNEFLSGEKTLKQFVESIEKPRKVIVMVQAGSPVDAVISQLTPLLSKNDTIIDCGNSNYKDTQRRFEELKKKGLNFMGCGVSGGEEGALNGPSLMPGGSRPSYTPLSPIFKKIAAKDFSGSPCVTYIGDNGAGHYTKTVHNGIEYAVMQIMAEGYEMLRKIYGLDAKQISDIFREYNRGRLNSYLFEIASEILSNKDNLRPGYLIDSILDKAAQKGTGTWTAIDSLEHATAAPSITSAVYARIISNRKDERLALGKSYKKSLTKKKISQKVFTQILEEAMYAAMISAYAQGYDLITRTAKEEGWKLNLAEISRIWEGGCIIRAKILNFLHKAYTKNKKTTHLFEIPEVKRDLNKFTPSLRELTAFAALNSVPIPALYSSLSYFESFTTANSPANFIQGLRDYFGAHTYERTDRKGPFHTDW